MSKKYTRGPTTVEIEGPWDDSPGMAEKLATFTGGLFAPEAAPSSSVVWNELEQDWINVPLGHFIVRGTKGEYYPIAPELLDPANPDHTYAPVV